MLVTSSVSAVLTAGNFFPEREPADEEFYAADVGTASSKSSSSSIFASKTVSDNSTPTLTFMVRLGLEGHEPMEGEHMALLCQLQRFVERRLREKTGDLSIASNLLQLDWNNTQATSTWHVEFEVQSTFGSGQSISSWSLVKLLELQTRDIQKLVRHFVWTLHDTTFASTRTLFWGGKMFIEKKPRTLQMEELRLDSCPPPPPSPPPTESPTSVPSNPTDEIPFGEQIEIQRNDNRLPLF
jgi:hypothetical protein